MQKLNRTAKLNFFKARKRKGDLNSVAENTGYSKSHVSNVVAGRRSVPQSMADEMYRISRRRTTNKEVA
jgi:plasmid maintenance system antidote protein VapI